MIVLDDLALPCGKIRIRPGGSDGGHNGLSDIQRALGTNQYPRLRIGHRSPRRRPCPERITCSAGFRAEQRKLIDPAIDRAASAILTWIDKGIESAMNAVQRQEKKASSRSRRINFTSGRTTCRPNPC